MRRFRPNLGLHRREIGVKRTAMSDPLPKELQRFRPKEFVYFGTKRLYRFFGKPPKAYFTDLKKDGKPVIFLHAPKVAGTSLRAMLHTDGMTHSMPRHVLRPSFWHNSFSIASVRHPFDRFVSGYTYFVAGDFKGVLYRAHGDALSRMDPFTFLTFIQQYPEKLGLQSNWACYPSVQKPRADVILRIEDSATWMEQLTDAGLDLKGRTLERRNVSRKGGKNYASLLGLTEPEVADLRERVYAVFQSDYSDFDYDP
jgi:hypothetical protein